MVAPLLIIAQMPTLYFFSSWMKYQTKVIEFFGDCHNAKCAAALVTNLPNQFVMTQLMFQQQVHFMSAL